MVHAHQRTVDDANDKTHNRRKHAENASSAADASPTKNTQLVLEKMKKIEEADIGDAHGGSQKKTSPPTKIKTASQIQQPTQPQPLPGAASSAVVPSRSQTTQPQAMIKPPTKMQTNNVSQTQQQPPPWIANAAVPTTGVKPQSPARPEGTVKLPPCSKAEPPRSGTEPQAIIKPPKKQLASDAAPTTGVETRSPARPEGTVKLPPSSKAKPPRSGTKRAGTAEEKEGKQKPRKKKQLQKKDKCWCDVLTKEKTIGMCHAGFVWCEGEYESESKGKLQMSVL